MYTKIPLTKIMKMALVQTNGKKTVAQVKAEQGCQYVLNCTLYSFTTFKPLCPCRIDGKTITTTEDGYWCYAFNTGSDFKMIHSDDMEKYYNVFACSTMLKDGKNTILSYNKDQGGVRGRSAIGIDKNGNLVLFCSKDGTSLAMSPERLRDYMKNTLGCISAIMLDSGQSSSCDFNGQKITTTRKVANYLCVWAEEIKSETPIIPKTNPYTVPTVTLRQGSKGMGVKWLQWELINRRFLSEFNSNGKSNIDGIFGPDTKVAIMKLQESLGFKGKDIDGIVGKATRMKLT